MKVPSEAIALMDTVASKNGSGQDTSCGWDAVQVCSDAQSSTSVNVTCPVIAGAVVLVVVSVVVVVVLDELLVLVDVDSVVVAVETGRQAAIPPQRATMPRAHRFGRGAS